MNLDRVQTLLGKLPIRDKLTQKLVPFNFTPGQQRIHETFKKQQAAGRPMRIVTLKSRRQGISSYTEALLTSHCVAREGTNAMIVTHKFKSSEALFSVPKTLMNEYRPGKQPLRRVLSLPAMTQQKITFPHHNGDSALTIATAGNVEGGRGMTLTDLHLSEVAFYASDASFAALMPTVPKDPDTIIILESTANGRTGIGEPFFNFWNASIEGNTGYKAVFLSWLEDPTCVDYNRNVSDAPIDDEEKILINDFHAKPEQLSWRRNTLEGPECRGLVEIFDQEYPRTADVAFISTGQPAFTPSEMAYVTSTVRDPIDIGYIKTLGKDSFRWISDSESPDWTLPPSNTEPPILGLLSMWDEPKLSRRYYIGEDAARGEEGKDFAAFVVWDGESGEQVAEYCERTNPEAMVHILYAVGMYYNRAMINIELTGNLGLWTQSRLRDHYNYSNLYRWRGSRDDSTKPYRKQATYGWETGVRSREYALVSYRECIHNKIITVRSERLVYQMSRCSRKDAWERWDIEYGHDDLLMAAMIGNVSRYQWHPKSTARSIAPRPEGQEANAMKSIKVMSGFENTVVGLTAQIIDQYIREAERPQKQDRLKGI